MSTGRVNLPKILIQHVVLGDGFRKGVQDFDRFVVSSGNHVEGASLRASDVDGGLREKPSAQSNGVGTQSI